MQTFESMDIVGAQPTVPLKLNQKKKDKGIQLRDSIDDSDEENDVKQKNGNRNKYGKMKVLYEGATLITLGPDYWCFLPTFICFAVASYFLIELVFSTTTNQFVRIITLIVCIGECLSYLLVATSNPGIVTNTTQLQYRGADQKKTCHKCGFDVPKKSRHCSDCDVCVEQYDHHCPWTSKCIGGGNLKRFYLFLAWTPCFLIYVTIAFVMCMGQNLSKIQKLPAKKMI